MLHAAFDFPRHPLAREQGERVRGQWHSPPTRWLVAQRAEDLRDTLNAAHAAAQQGAWVLGGLRYEAAAALDPHLPTHPPEGPLAQFAVFEQAPAPWRPPTLEPPARPSAEPAAHCRPWTDSGEPAAAHAQAIERVRAHIRAGDCYQVNLTTRLHSQLQGDLAALFFALHAAQPGGFSLFLREAGVASVSPELFFDWRPLPEAPATWLLAAQPMKGTAARGVDRASDEAAQAHLRTSDKERAENLMIVDLLRNDLGRIARLGSVRVPRLFELHALPSVWQMSSTVSAVTPRGQDLAGVFGALFPCGSVTGAPKRSAMQRIVDLEPSARGWYCGALGLLQPGGSATFNVPIRTVETAPDGRLRAGLGSGITLDSDAQAELDEWQAKARFLVRAQAPVTLLETLRLQDGHFPQRDAHLARLARSGRHFGLGTEAAGAALDALAAQHPQGLWRVRLLLGAQGPQATATPFEDFPPGTMLRLALADQPLRTRGREAEFIAHKTTRRAHYDVFWARKPASAFDLLLWNEDGELTEGCIGNLALQIDGRWLTPRRAAGLLAGVRRADLLAQGRLQEATLTRTDLARATGLAWFNALRGWWAAELLEPAPPADASHRP